MAKYICPYCFTEHGFEDIEFRCINSYCEKKEPDERYAKYLHMKAAPVKNVVFYSGSRLPKLLRNKFMPMWENCPCCGMKSTVRLCPDCHNELPEGIQDHENIIIAVVGSRDTGKTHYISVLINELQNRICPNLFQGTFNPLNDDIMQHYKEHFYDRVFQEKRLQNLTVTAKQSGENAVRKPLIYEMIAGGNGKKIKKYTFVFYDAAGEDLKNDEVMRVVNPYICRAAGIIFLLDPMQIRELRANMEESEIKSSSSISENEIEPQEQVLRRIANLIRENRGIKKTEPIPHIPAAIAFSKFDVLKRFFPKGSIVLEPSGFLKEGKLDQSEWFTVHNEIESMLKEYGASGFTLNVERNFKNFTYCTFSALGQLPILSEKGKLIERIPAPHRVEDPFLWLLKENKVIGKS